MKIRKMLRIRRNGKSPDVRDRICLNILIERDIMSATRAAAHTGMVRSWGVK